jgi:hypothetical protein
MFQYASNFMPPLDRQSCAEHFRWTRFSERWSICSSCTYFYLMHYSWLWTSSLWVFMRPHILLFASICYYWVNRIFHLQAILKARFITYSVFAVPIHYINNFKILPTSLAINTFCFSFRINKEKWVANLMCRNS